MTTITREIIAARLGATPSDYAAAIANHGRQGELFGLSSCYAETSVRATMRALLDGAGDTRSTVQLVFLKKSGARRPMVALPIPAADQTNQFYTVQDLELSAQAGRKVFRRVNLDAIVAAQVEFHMGAL